MRVRMRMCNNFVLIDQRISGGISYEFHCLEHNNKPILKLKKPTIYDY